MKVFSMLFDRNLFLEEQNAIPISDLLDQLEIDLSHIGQGNYALAEKILFRLDAVKRKISAQESMRIPVTAETAQFEYIQRSLEKNGASFIHDLGGLEKLIRLRESVKPENSSRWWFPDQFIENNRNKAIKSVVLTFVILTAVVILFFLAFNTFLKPDPIVVAQYNHQMKSEEYLAKNDLNQALTEINAAIALGEDPELFVIRGVIESQTGNKDAGEADFSAAEKIAGSRNIFLGLRAETWLRTRQFDKAISDTLEMIENDPDSALGFYYFAKAHELKQDYQIAVMNYQIASDLAEKQGKIELNATIRMSMAMLMQAVPANYPATQTSTP
jgi:tetratricopeptide (TPR) repeat protein